MVSIISSAGASFHASNFPQLNHSTHLCPFWWGMCRGSGRRPWQIRDYSNGFCHSLGIRFSYESHLFCESCLYLWQSWIRTFCWQEFGTWGVAVEAQCLEKVQESNLAISVSDVSHLLEQWDLSQTEVLSVPMLSPPRSSAGGKSTWLEVFLEQSLPGKNPSFIQLLPLDQRGSNSCLS